MSAYAREKYQLEEQHKWSDFPGFSVLCHPDTKKWVALLMRQWDTETGTMIERCDMKCGAHILNGINKPYLSAPIRMQGQKWIGIAFDAQTDPDVVFRLFDYALSHEEQRGYTIVLDGTAVKNREACRDTPLPFANGITKGFPKSDAADSGKMTARDIPKKIREMRKLYEYGDSSLSHKAKNFYHQGKLMQDYEDNLPWEGEYRRYFTTYHDLNLRQLRGYFTWRTHIRKGDFRPIATSLAYIYIYELLNGIGTDSPEDALSKMREFDHGYIGSGVGDPGMLKNLYKWMFEYAILNALPAETVMRYADPEILKKDAALAVLKTPRQHTEEEIFTALCTFAEKTPAQSPVVMKDKIKARHLFSGIWKHLSGHYHENGKNIFTACFGERKAYGWHPLSNAVYYENQAIPDTDFILNECRSYHCRGGIWQEKRYDNLYFDKALFQSIIHAADRILRRHCKTGHYLREKPGEAWLTPYIMAVLKAEQDAEAEAQRPRITIDFSSLTQIRQEALITRDSLLTEEETDEIGQPFAGEPEECRHNGFDEFDGFDELDELDGFDRFNGLDTSHLQILTALLSGQSVADTIKNRHLMPSVVTDTINDALFDEIGDNILECDGDRITFVEDYREDVIEALGGSINE